jgi:hypothetical protein
MALGFFHLATEIRGRHAVCLVTDDEVPVWCRLELRLQLVRPGSHVETYDEPMTFDKGIAGDRRFDLVP